MKIRRQYRSEIRHQQIRDPAIEVKTETKWDESVLQSNRHCFLCIETNGKKMLTKTRIRNNADDCYTDYYLNLINLKK